MRPLVSSARLTRGPAHDVVRVWNRGGMAGDLTVMSGDGAKLVAVLLGLDVDGVEHAAGTVETTFLAKDEGALTLSAEADRYVAPASALDTSKVESF